MDQILVQEVDDILRQRLPRKSSISGVHWVPVYPDNTGSLALSTASTYRFRLPRVGGGYLAVSKGQTGPFFSFSIATNAAAAFEGEVYGVFRQCRILVNGTEAHNNLYFNHTYAEWLKTKPSDWLRSDGGNFGMANSFSGVMFPALASQNSGTVYTLPYPDNYSVISNKNHALPLEYLDVVIEMTLNDFGNIMGLAASGASVTSATMSNLTLWIPVTYVDHEVDMAIKAKLEAADEDDKEMLLLYVQDVKADMQSYDFSSAGTKAFVWNSTSSMCRLLEAKISIDAGAASTTNYKTLTGLTGGVTSYQFKIDGKNVPYQNPVTTGVTATDVALAYPLYQDFVSAYNQINNNEPQMSTITKAQFLGSAATNPAHGAALASSFAMVANLDTVSKDLVNGAKLINNLTLEVTCDGNGAQSNVYLIQHSNRLIGISKNRCRVLK